MLALTLSGLSPGSALIAQDTKTKTFSPEVVAKADKILEEIGLKRSGKTIAAANTAEVSRAISALSRERRQLKLVYDDWKKANDQLGALQQHMKRLNIQDGELNLQLARVAGADVDASNRVVGLINAGRSKIKSMVLDIENAQKFVGDKREKLSQAEAAYAEMVLAIRKDFEAIREKLNTTIGNEQTKIALSVMQRNFDTPPVTEITAAKILASLEKRIEKIEQEIFSASIPMNVQKNGSLYVDVVVGKKTTQMVVDSGATLISLPAETAADLGITVPEDAPSLKLIMADGREIPAKAVVLSRVRVGEFEAENVRAAILHSSATGAEPLLGMSYLSNFKFEINTNEKTLKMLRVSAE